MLLMHGPNLNMLGSREPEIYGSTTLNDIEAMVREPVEKAGHAFRCFQSNSEGQLVDWLQQNHTADFLIINAGAYTHTSVALRDAIKFTGIPFVEIHISNVYSREEFRHHSYLSDLALAVMAGFGAMGYELATRYALEYIKKNS